MPARVPLRAVRSVHGEVGPVMVIAPPAAAAPMPTQASVALVVVAVAVLVNEVDGVVLVVPAVLSTAAPALVDMPLNS